MNQLNIIVETLKQIKQHFLLFASIAVLDIFFFMFYGFLTFPITEKIIEHAVLISNEISKQLAQREISGALTYLFSPEVTPILTKMLMLMGILFTVIYILYVIFQGTTWWITRKITQQKIPFYKYMIGFAKINILWVGCYAIYKLLDTIIAVRHAIILKIAPGTINIGGYVILALFLLTAIAAMMSYPTLRIKQIFNIPIKKTALIILTNLALFLIAKGIIAITSKYVSFTISLFIALIIMFPIIAFIKIYTMNSVTNDTQH